MNPTHSRSRLIASIALAVLAGTVDVSAQVADDVPPAARRDSLAAFSPLPTAGRKSPGTALALSLLIPGAGHFYAGEPKTGAVLLVGSVGAVVAGAALSDPGETTCDWWFTNCTTEHENFAPLGIGLVVFGVLYWYGVIDAPAAARRSNERHGWIDGRVRVMPDVSVVRGGVRPGLRLSVTLD